MTSEATKQWSAELIQGVQEMLDRSAATAGPGVAPTFARDDWRLSAEDFLNKWSSVRMCIVGSAGAKGQPHLAAIHAGFQDDGKLTFRMYRGSVREKDFEVNPRLALNKYTPEGAVMTVYGRRRIVPGGDAEAPPGSGRVAALVEVEISRIYAMQPQRNG